MEQQNSPTTETASGMVISPRLRKLIQSLDDRYPPAANQSTDQRKRQLQLLAEDIAAVPVEMAERAVKHWIVTSAFMPKAADVFKLVNNFRSVGTATSSEDNAWRLAQNRNAQMDIEPNARQSIRWIVERGQLKLVPIAEYRAR